MLKHQRRRRIVELVRQKRTCTVEELCEQLGISTITLYRDLRGLDEDNIIRRVHGGVTLREPDVVVSRFADRLSMNSSAKDQIGRAAAKLVQENSGIFIDASSTCYCFAQYLAQRSDFRLTLVTSSPSIPLLFEACPQFRIISTGGELHQMLNAYGGPMAMRLLESMNFDSAFISCAGFDVAHGATSDSPVLVEMLHSASMRAREIVLLADSAKFSRLAMMTTLRAKEITKIVTDRGIDNDILRRIQDAGIEVTIAGSETTDSSSSPSETADNDIDVEQTSSNLSKQAQGIKENDHAC